MVKHLRPCDSASRPAPPRGAAAMVGLVVVIMMAAAGCGRGGPSGHASPGTPASRGTTGTSGPAAACRSQGAALRIAARDSRFDHQCLAGPAGTPLVITFSNQDRGVVHNLAIYSDPQRSKALFRGKLVQGVVTVVYRVPPLPAGSYFFQCDVHPQTMNGAFIIR
jgi:plastocyanin